MSHGGHKFYRPDNRGDRYPMVETNKHHCLTERCRGVVNKKTERSPYCYKCRWRRWKSANPLRYSFGNLRRRAKQRGKEWSLTFEQYKKFAEKTDYAALKGRTTMSLTIDRIDNNRGYHFWNLRAISLSRNSRREFVPFYARQIENAAYQPTAEEIAEVESKMKE